MKAFFSACCVMLIVVARPARADRVLQHYDVDSLAFLSAAIVRAEVGESRPFNTPYGNCRVHNVRVVDVFKGSVAVGSSLRVTGLDVFQRAPGIVNRLDSWSPIGKGDKVHLFLTAK
jgi:hypothetical protein